MHFELEEILTLIDKVKKTGLESFEYKDTDTKIKIRGVKPQVVQTVQATPVMVAAEIQEAVEETAAGHVIEAPMVGTFYATPSEGADPFVKPGDAVKKGQTVCIIEAMKLMNEIAADIDGIVDEVLVENEAMVEFGQPLVRIRKAE